MDPITGVIALTGLTVASLAGLRLKKQLSEGFEVPSNQGYRQSVEESQTRYNALTSMVNPLLNSIIPVDATNETKQAKQKDLDTTLEGALAPYDPNSPEAFKIKEFLNRFRVRSDTQGGLFEIIRFCRDAAKENGTPYTTYVLDSDGNKTDTVARPGKTKTTADGTVLKFDELCGVCLTSGIDEDGKPFTGQKGMLVDPSTVEASIKEQRDFSYPFPRVAPSLGKCEGAPTTPAFAINQETLDLYMKRINCMKTKEISETNNCGLCYENDTFAFVPQKVQKNTISLVLMGTGKCTVTVKTIPVKTDLILDNTTPVTVPLLINQDTWTFDNSTQKWKMQKQLSTASEGDPFSVEVKLDPAQPDEIPNLYGYLSAANPNGGQFAMPLNLIFTRDSVTNSTPNKTGGFYQFKDVGLEVARMRPGSQTGQEMKPQGEVPFTFVQSSEFSGIDCPSAPFQTKSSSVSRFATDQPCYAKGAKPGNYSDACLRERILDVGCTNGGELYQNPKTLNTGSDGTPNSLSKIYAILKDIAENDLQDPVKTKQCSGRTITGPCDPFRFNSKLKFESILNGVDKANASKAPAVKQCLAYLYNNKGSTEVGYNILGASYTGPTSYKNDTSTQKNVYCLPSGELNPENSNDSLLELARMYDNGFRGSVGVDGVKNYLQSILDMALNQQRNANTDPDRKAAIRKCFGTDLSPLQADTVSSANPAVEPDPPKYTIKDSNGRSWKLGSGNTIKLSSGTAIEVDFGARSDVYKSSQGRVGLFIGGDPSKAIRHAGFYLYSNAFQANNFDFAWYPIKGSNNTVFFYNDYGDGYFIGYDTGSDRLLIVSKTDTRRVAWTVEPYPTNFVKDEPSLLVVPTPQSRLPTSFTPTLNTIIGTAQCTTDYILTMNITPRGIVWNWGSIVHFTGTGRDCCSLGDRMPAIWFWPQSLRLHIRIGDATDGNWGVDTNISCTLNQVNTFSLECRGRTVTMRLNNETQVLTQPSTRPSGLATVYAADPWYSAANASISNFSYVSLN